MRCIINRLALVSAALMIVAGPVLADEGSMEGKVEQGQESERNECLLVAANCANQVDSIQQRIERIKGEIGRGTEVYTDDELGTLNRKLEEAIKTLESESVSGGG